MLNEYFCTVFSFEDTRTPTWEDRTLTYVLLTDEKVKEWFLANKINMAICDFLRANSGKILKQMFSIKKSSNEFFYQSLKQIENIEFHEVVLFGSCLDELFN